VLGRVDPGTPGRALQGLHVQVGHGMKFEFVPLDQLRGPAPQRSSTRRASSSTCHRDSQWIRRRGRETGTTSSCNEFFEKNGIKMSTSSGHGHRLLRVAEEPPNYWALPAMGDAVGEPTARLFARPEIKAEFR